MLNSKKMEKSLEPEKTTVVQREARERPSPEAHVVAQPCPNLARLLTALEIRDDHHVDKGMFKKPAIERELELVREEVKDEFIGILAKCRINGCDVHALNSALEIHKHYRDNETIEEDFLKARDVAAKLPESIIAVLVFKKHISYLYQNGKVEVVSEK